MIQELFQKNTPPFIRVRDAQLYIAGQSYSHITAQIQELKPVRKFFYERKLKCYSLDCQTGKDGQFCALCKDRPRCSRRIQLALLCVDGKQQYPAIIDVPSHSFEALDKLIAEVGSIDELPNALIAIKPVYGVNDRTELEFEVLY